MTQNAQQVLKSATLYSDEVMYRVVRLPAAALTAAAGVLAEVGEPFGALVIDKDEVTLVIADDDLSEFARRLPDHVMGETRYRLITFDIELEPTLTGFMAIVSRSLADAGVPILPYSAFSRDHLLVPAQQFDAAQAALDTLRAGL